MCVKEEEGCSTGGFLRESARLVVVENGVFNRESVFWLVTAMMMGRLVQVSVKDRPVTM